jgi:hypothetical protein
MAISWITFACVFGGALFGNFLRAVLPEHHLSTESKDVMKLGTGLIATMTALVLGLLIATAKDSYDTQRSGLTQVSVNLVLLDRFMAHYGPETKEARDLLRSFVVRGIDQIWPEAGSRPAQLAPMAANEAIYVRIQALSPKNEAQRSLQAKALSIATDIGHARWLSFQRTRSSIPVPFLLVVIFWLTIIFVSFGLFASPNATVIAVLLLCALSVAGAIFLILELDTPFDGLIQISSAPMHAALAQLGQ